MVLARRVGALTAEPMIPVNERFRSGIGEQWHKCADEARSVADDMDEISKQMMLSNRGGLRASREVRRTSGTLVKGGVMMALAQGAG